MRQLIAVALFCAGLFCIAQAQVPMTGAGLGAPGGSPAGFQGSGDILSGAIGYWSCARAYTAAYASGGGNACDILRTSDSLTCTLKFAASGFVDLSTNYCNSNTQNVPTFCNATTCRVTKAYDQSGANDCGAAACPISEVSSSGPNLGLLALNGLPCMTFNASNTFQSASTNNAHAQPISGSMVAERTGAFTGFGTIIGEPGGAAQFLYNSAANQSGIYAGTIGAAQQVATSDSSYHAINDVLNGSSSIVVIDGSATTGLSPGAGTIGANSAYSIGNGNQGATASICEVRLDAAAYNSTQYGNLNTNQHSATSGYNF